jgi:hypothetical protein
MPRCAASVAKARPAGPAPTTATRAFRAASGMGRDTRMVSWQARGLTRHEVILPPKVWSRQAWLQPMQVLMSCERPCAALATNSGSARKGRAMLTMSAWPVASTSSATSGVLMRLVATSGMPTLPLSCCVTHANAARGTLVAMVGMRASCQPMPVFRMVTPAASSAWASCTTSSRVEPPSTRSSMDRRKMMMKWLPTRSRVRRTISSAKRMRLS